MGFLSSCAYVNTTVRMHCLNTNETLGEKAGWEPHIFATCCLEKILKVAPNKIAAVGQLNCHLTHHPSQKNQICMAVLEKQGRTHKRSSFVDSYVWTRQCRPTSKDLHTTALCGH